MKQTLKKLTDKVSSFSKNKKQLWLTVLLFSVAGIVLPFFFARAGLGTEIATPVVLAFFKVIFQLLLIIPTVILGLVVGFLTLVVSPTFIDISYTNNAFVLYGWTITKDLVNMGFIIILAFIGLGTALRIQEYQWQKTLPRLFFILLIINFTPVICGFFIDAANIVINYFLNGATGWAGVSNALSRMSTDLLNNQLRGITNITELVSTSGVIVIELLAIMLTTWMAIFIYCLFMILFLARYIMLWVLIILSPIAFFTYVFKESHLVKTIFPGTLHWEEWWNNFLQWSIIGVTLSFFLFLSNNLQGILDSGAITLSSLPPSVKGSGIMNDLMPYIVNLTLLVVGFLTAIKTAPMGANVITSKVRGAVGRATKVVVKTAKGTAIGGGRAIKGVTSAAADHTKGGRWAKRQLKAVEESETMKKARYYTPGVKTMGEKARGDEEARNKFERDYKKRAQAGHMDEIERISKDPLKSADEREGAKRVIGDYRPDKLGKNMEKTIKEKSAKAYAKVTMPEALEDINVLAAMDQDKYDAIGGKEGSPAQRESIMKGIMKPADEKKPTGETVWQKKYKEIKKTDPEKADKMSDIFDKLQADPNYFGNKTKKKSKKQKAKKRKKPPEAWYG